MVLLDDITNASDAVRVAERLRAVLVDAVRYRRPSGLHVGGRWNHRQHDRLRAGRTGAAGRRHCASPREEPGASAPYELFDPAMRERAVTRLQLETDLRKAIDNEGNHGSLPAHHFARDGFDQGLRGARALAPSRARTDQSRRLHSDCGRHRPDSPARQARSRRVVPADGGVAAAVRSPRAGLHVRQRLRRPVRGARSRSRCREDSR